MAGGSAVTYVFESGVFSPGRGGSADGTKEGGREGLGRWGGGDGEEACGRRRSRCWLLRWPDQPCHLIDSIRICADLGLSPTVIRMPSRGSSPLHGP